MESASEKAATSLASLGILAAGPQPPTGANSGARCPVPDCVKATQSGRRLNRKPLSWATLMIPLHHEARSSVPGSDVGPKNTDPMLCQKIQEELEQANEP
jgi:hypothetical protein